MAIGRIKGMNRETANANTSNEAENEPDCRCCALFAPPACELQH
jgi:hypothetical protein